jgi:AcrR family transcriptional regulator
MSEPSVDPTRREQRTADSRQRILDAAVECLIENGYHGASTLRIQARAGVSRGRLLHHFASRDVLLVAASKHLAAQRVQGTTQRVTSELQHPRNDTDRVDLVIELMWGSFHEPHYWAAVELWTAARTEDVIAQALLPEERRLGGVIRSSVDEMFGAALSGHPRYPQLRELLLTSMRGVALTYGFDHRDPRTDPHLAQWKDTAHVLLEL